jgi:hypothetical protein
MSMHVCACPPGACVAADSLFQGGKVKELPVEVGVVSGIDAAWIEITNGETYLKWQDYEAQKPCTSSARCLHR